MISHQQRIRVDCWLPRGRRAASYWGGPATKPTKKGNCEMTNKEQFKKGDLPCGHRWMKDLLGCADIARGGVEKGAHFASDNPLGFLWIQRKLQVKGY